jgi:hypothetical protein
MKTEQESPKVVSTTKIKLTLKGQTFDVTAEELKALREEIDKAIGKPDPVIVYRPVPTEPGQRPYYGPPPQWREAIPMPEYPPYRITCGLNRELS